MSYIKRAEKYAKSVISGKIPACQYVINACKRFEKDLKRKDITLKHKRPGKVLYEGDRWCAYLEKLPHVKGKWASKKETFVLSDWQVFCTVNIFGWVVKETGLRRFREAYIEVPRKNGKTFWIAGLGNGMLAIDEEYGAEVYCGATSEKQAYEVFRPAKQICERLPDFREQYGIETFKSTITILRNGSRFEPVIGDPGDGASPSCGIADEFHEHKTSDLVDTFVTGMGAREQPLMIYITTAGSDMGGPCYEKRSDVIDILKGTVEDDQIFGIVYTLDEGDEWDTIEAQKKANPNYGISVDPGFLKGQLSQARRSAVKQVAYKTKHLNQWVGAKAAWMNMLAFQACRKKKLDIKDYAGRECIAAFDLASKIDFASRAVLFPPIRQGEPYTAFCRHYLPEDVILEGGNTRYKAWHADGWIEATPGNVIDFDYIEQDLKELAVESDILEVPYDPHQATQFSTRMMSEGFEMIEVRHTVLGLSEAMKELEKLILSKQIQFDYDPVLMWMFGNVVAQLDKKDNIYPNKERPDNKIDGVVALIMAISRIVHKEPDEYISEEPVFA